MRWGAVLSSRSLWCQEKKGPSIETHLHFSALRWNLPYMSGDFDLPNDTLLIVLHADLSRYSLLALRFMSLPQLRELP
jgi:hypothetical protein